MIAYQKQEFENTFLLKEAKDLCAAQFITDEQLKQTEARITGYKTHSNYLVRGALYFLGVLLFGSSCGLLALMFFSASNEAYKSYFFVCSFLGFISTEVLINSYKYYAYGIDDAFIFCSQLFLAIGLYVVIDDFNLMFYVVVCIVSIIASIRYVDSFSAVVACFSAISIVFSLFLLLGDIGQMLLPFVLMICAYALFRLYLFLNNDERIPFYYCRTLTILFVCSLVLFYAAGNYLVVRQATEELLHKTVDELPMAWFFYVFTFAVPALYIYWGLKKMNRYVLWTGFLALAFSIYTIRYYHSVLPVEWALILGGAILFIIALLATQKLKGKTEGLTFERDKFTFANNDLLNAEAIAVAQNFAMKPNSNSESPMGGGSFGGGGSGADY